jgi:hypothetical protein
MESSKKFFGLMLATSVSAFHLTSSHNVSNPTTACEILKQSYPNITYLPEDAGYTDENQGKLQN